MSRSPTRRKVAARLLAPGIALLIAGSCASSRPVPAPPAFPTVPAWKTLLGDFVVAPLATDGRRVFVATRDAVVRALDPDTGEVTWKVEGLAGRVSASEGFVVVRSDDGTLSSLQPRGGALRWKAETGVGGTLPAVLDGDRALVAGRGVAAVSLEDGRLLWKDDAAAETTAPPVSAGSRLLSGEADGTLRCRDRATGVTLWTLRTGRALVAPPLVAEDRRRLYLGTTDRRILEVSIDSGEAGWAWRVGADVSHPGLLLPGQVAFASLDAVLYSVRRGGNLAWRRGLPSRPLSGPMRVGGHLLVACLENEIVAFAPDTGEKAGSFRTATEIRTAPVLAGGHLVVGLRDRSVVAFPVTPPATPEAGAPSPPGATPAAPGAAPVVPPPPGR